MSGGFVSYVRRVAELVPIYAAKTFLVAIVVVPFFIATFALHNWLNVPPLGFIRFVAEHVVFAAFGASLLRVLVTSDTSLNSAIKSLFSKNVVGITMNDRMLGSRHQNLFVWTLSLALIATAIEGGGILGTRVVAIVLGVVLYPLVIRIVMFSLRRSGIIWDEIAK